MAGEHVHPIEAASLEDYPTYLHTYGPKLSDETVVTGITFRGHEVELDYADAITCRQAQAWALGAVGLNEAQSGWFLGVSGHTAKAHRGRMFERIGAAGMAHSIHVIFDRELARPRLADGPTVTLSDEEFEIMDGLAAGLTVKQISERSAAGTNVHTLDSRIEVLRNKRLPSLPNAPSLVFYGYVTGALAPLPRGK